MVQAEEAPRMARPFRFSRPILVATQAYPPLGGGSSTIMKNLLDPIEPGSIVLAVQKPDAAKERLAPADGHHRHFVERLTTLPGRIEQYRRYLWRPVVQRRLTILGRSKGVGAVVGVYPDLFFLDAARRAASGLNVPFIPYLHDTVAESQAASRFARYAARVQEQVFSCSEQILVATRGMSTLYREKYAIQAIPIVHIYPEIKPQRPPTEAGSRDLFWSGNIYGINMASLRRVYQALGRMRGVGMTVASQQSEENLVRLGFTGHDLRKTYIPVRERHRYLEVLHRHGVLVLALSWPDETSIHEDELRTIFPTKTPEYLASGRPILVHCPDHYYLARFFRENKCGEVISERNVTLIEERIRRLLEDGDYQRRLGEAALQAAHEFAPERVLPVFHREVQGALDRG